MIALLYGIVGFFVGISIVLSVWSAWGTYQNTKTIHSIIDSLDGIVKNSKQINKIAEILDNHLNNHPVT